MEKWRATFQFRFNENRDDNMTVTQYLEEWPALLDIRAPALVSDITSDITES